RVDAPLVAGVVVRGTADAVDRGIAHVDVGRGHVDLGAQHHAAVGVPAVAHFAEQRQIFLDAAVAIGRILAGFGQGAAVGTHLLRGLPIDVGVAVLDQALGGTVHEIEVI